MKVKFSILGFAVFAVTDRFVGPECSGHDASVRQQCPIFWRRGQVSLLHHGDVSQSERLHGSSIPCRHSHGEPSGQRGYTVAPGMETGR
jgi:hypothetical protein